MKKTEKVPDKKCQYFDCENTEYLTTGKCEYHFNGGVFGSGETYEQYSIIERDFIEFINVVPLDDPAHLNVHSPVLRDIIIRSCVQIEIFFKEWAKYECLDNKNHELWEKYNKPGKERNWSFGSYFVFKDKFQKYYSVNVRLLNENISPFQDWKDIKNPPFWWNAYNSIKHNGINAKKEANLKNALFSLGGLFLMHFINLMSFKYLESLNYDTLKSYAGDVIIEKKGFSSPMDSKRYLFKINSPFDRKIELVTKEQLKNTNDSFIRRG